MAKRPSIQEILEAARKGGPAKRDEAAAPSAEPETQAFAGAAEAEAAAVEAEAASASEEPAAAEPAAPAVEVPTPATLGRPLTLKEKLAAARTAGAAKPGAAAAPAAAASRPAAPKAAPAAPPVEEAAAEEAPAAEAAAKVPAAAPAKPLGRPMTLQEKLAAARGGAAKPAAAAAAPAAGKPAAAPAAKAGAARVLPPLEKMTDPRDLAEAARQAAAKKAKESSAKPAAAAAAPAKVPAAKAAPPKPQTVPPRPARELAAAGAEGSSRRGFLIGTLFVSWIVLAWVTFTGAMVAWTLMSLRFMFPNVLAEPPSTIKIGLPANYDPEDVSDRFKAEWGFWVVRSTRYGGQDIIYALQSICTHLGCPPNWLASEQKFKCPCHGSGFYITGINFEGPAPRPLERFKVAMADDGQILVDKSQKFQEELGQWADPDSFISA
jgi:cytochrome b6-f complex iron-sulfur subunit